jgi:magnesium transporter
MRDPKRRERHLRAALATRRRRTGTRPGTPPGTLVGAETAVAPVLSVIAFTRTDLSEARDLSLAQALARVSPGQVTWINVDGHGDAALFARLGERFGLHPLALEDVLNVGQRPKVERYDKHYFVVLRTLRRAGTDDAEPAEEEQVSLFFGADWIITVQERSDGDCFDAVREAIRQGRGRVREAGADFLAYLILDAVVDAYFPVIESTAERLHALEEEAVAAPPDGTLLSIQRLRHELLALRRAVWPMREEVAVLQRDESGLVSAETKVFLRDVYDHAIQALELVETLREAAVSVLEVYLSAQNQRLNAVMKVLTVIATVFIPLTFIASIYGMNFDYMPELRWRYGYAFALGLMAVTAGLMIAYFRRKGWW